MNALRLRFTPASYISARIPYSWQSALSYPIPPPSAFLGMAAGALMRTERISEQEALKAVQSGRLSVHARLVSPCRIKSHLLVSITKFKVSKGKRPTDALGRQFVFAHEYETVFLSPDLDIIERLSLAFKFAPIYFGDSESLVSVTHKDIIQLELGEQKDLVKTKYYVPLTAFEDLSSQGTIFHVHESLQKGIDDEKKSKSRKKQYPLIEYIFPLAGDLSGYQPVEIRGRVHWNFNIYQAGKYAFIRKAP